MPPHLQKIEDAKDKSTGTHSKPINKAVTIKAARTIGGMLFGHELLLTALPFLKRFVKANVKVIPKGTGVAGGPNFPTVPQIGSIPSASPISAIMPDQGNRTVPKRTKNGSGNGRGYVATLLAVAACIGLFVFLRNDGVATSQPKNEWETLSKSIVLVIGEVINETWSGSGTLVIDGSYILTNYHVAPGSNGNYSVRFTESFDAEPNEEYTAEFVLGDEANDLAILRIVDQFGEAVHIRNRTVIQPKTIDPALSEAITIIGFPSIGFSNSEITMTITRGSYSGKIEDQGQYFKTDALISYGNSGGAAFNSNGDFIGVPSAISSDDGSNATVGLIKPAQYAAELISKVKP